MSKTQQALELVQKRGLLRPCDLEAQRTNGKILNRLYERGLIEKAGRGLYAPISPTGITKQPSLAEAAQIL